MTQRMSLAAHLAQLCEACHNCKASGNDEWFDRHMTAISELSEQHLPSGSGIDNGVSVDAEQSGLSELVLSLSYHHMDECGFYDGWSKHTVTVRPMFTGLDIEISGRDRNGIKDYLHEVLSSALNQEIER